MDRVDGMEVLAKVGCSGSNCPTVYLKDDETVVVQGFAADSLFSSGLPEGEHAVSIPLSLLREVQL